jgi:hypothetical protein
MTTKCGTSIFIRMSRVVYATIVACLRRMMCRDSPASPSSCKEDMWRGMQDYTAHDVVFPRGLPDLRKDMLARKMPGASRSTAAKDVDKWRERTTKIRSDITLLKKHLVGFTHEQADSLLSVVDDMQTPDRVSIPFNTGIHTHSCIFSRCDSPYTHLGV